MTSPRVNATLPSRFGGALTLLCLLLCLLLANTAQATDVTASSTLIRGALVFNRATNTYDSTITITNLSQTPLIGPIKLIVAPGSPQVTLASPAGTTADGRPYALVSLPQDALVLVRGQPVKAVLKFNNPSRTAFIFGLALDAYLPPANMPPDPGEAGKGTLLGVDIDGDGVRDDIQRLIEFKYPNSLRLRLAMREVAKSHQLWYSATNKTKATAISISQVADKNLSCVHAILGVEEGIRQTRLLFAEYVNTLDRYRKRAAFDDLLAGEAFVLPAKSTRSCAFRVADTAN